MTIQQRYDALTWWGKFVFQLNPDLWTMRWRIEELESELEARGAEPSRRAGNEGSGKS